MDSDSLPPKPGPDSFAAGLISSPDNLTAKTVVAGEQQAVPLEPYVGFKPPTEHGQCYWFPAANQWLRLWADNLELLKQQQTLLIGGKSLQSLRQQARQEMLELACRYSGQYLDLPRQTIDRRQVAIVMTGHQPELFHPGVWMKNFMADRLASLVNATAVNLIIDNDVVGHPRISFLNRGKGGLESKSLELDAGDPLLPFEERELQDRESFAGFCGRLKHQHPAEPTMLIEPLWSEIRGLLKLETGFSNLGRVLAAARHRLEQRAGLRTLEIPLSQLADTANFRYFFWLLVSRAEEFRQIHNQALAKYRKTFKLRSQSHPVPDLGRMAEWTETPFWIWSSNHPQRLPLYVSQVDRQVRLSNRQGWEVAMDEKDLEKVVAEDAGEDAGQSLAEFMQQQIKIRPRALMTTWYARLFLSDLFIHGTGGGRYDLLTNTLSERFFGCQLPGFAVASATFKLYAGGLPFGQNQPATEAKESEFAPPERLGCLLDALKISRNDSKGLSHLYRQLEVQPDRVLLALELASTSFLLDSRARDLISRKAAWIDGKISGSGEERHRAIAECNQGLQRWIGPIREELDQWLAEVVHWQREALKLDSREYSFALFPTSLLEELKDLARQIP